MVYTNILKIIRNIWGIEGLVVQGFIRKGLENNGMVDIDLKDGIKKEIFIKQND